MNKQEICSNPNAELSHLCQLAGLSTPEILWCRSPLDAIVLYWTLRHRLSSIDLSLPMGREPGEIREILAISEELRRYKPGKEANLAHARGLKTLARISPEDEISPNLDPTEDARDFVPWSLFWPEVVRGLDDAIVSPLGPETSWIWLLRTFAIVTIPPLEVHRDEEGRLHSEGRPAVRYSDGFGPWCRQGDWRKKDEPPPTTAEIVFKIAQDPDVSVRRLLMDRIGYRDLVKTSLARCLDRTKDGDLVLIYIPQDEPMAVIHLESTWHRVPPEIHRFEAARRWLRANRFHDYQPSPLRVTR